VISSLRGTVLSLSGGSAVIEVGGVGLAVQLTGDHALSLRLGDTAFVFTSLIVREDALSLFGFADKEQLDVFELLLGVTGVGPKSAMGVLAALSPERIAAAVDAEDDAVFRKVSGIGPKTAKLIVLSLAGKLVVTRRPQAAASARPVSSLGDSVLVALVGLGWPERVAAEAIAEVVADHVEGERDSVPALLRLALARLGPGQTPVRSGS
jgi:Holliday junction resolvasome, DNA-binding subunit